MKLVQYLMVALLLTACMPIQEQAQEPEVMVEETIEPTPQPSEEPKAVEAAETDPELAELERTLDDIDLDTELETTDYDDIDQELEELGKLEIS